MSGTSCEAIATAVRQVLSVRGPMAEDDLLGVLVADGVDLRPDPEDMLTDVLDQDAELVMPLADKRWAWIPALLDGRIFTHRLNALEAEHDMIGFGPDLAPLSMLTESQTYQRLTDGSPIADVSPFLDGDILAARGVPEMVVDDDGVLLLQPGRFATLGVAAGDLVGLRVTADAFELAAAGELTTCEIGPALAAVLDERPDRPEMLDVAVWTVCAGDEGLFREPVAPLVICSRLAAWPRRVTGLPVACSISAHGACMAGSRRSRRAPSCTRTRRLPCWQRCGSTSRRASWSTR